MTSCFFHKHDIALYYYYLFWVLISFANLSFRCRIAAWALHTLAETSEIETRAPAPRRRGVNVLVERHLVDQRTSNVLRTVVLHFRINSNTYTHFCSYGNRNFAEATTEFVRFTERPAKLLYQRTNSPTRSVARTISNTGFSVSRGNAHFVNFDSCSCIDLIWSGK